jgi:hypothetical protein
MYTAPWTDQQIVLLRRHYGEHGPTWDGWRELLPDKSSKAIAIKASRIGLAAIRHEKSVMALHCEGKPPSAIDAELGLPDGMAHNVIVRVWQRDKETP